MGKEVSEDVLASIRDKRKCETEKGALIGEASRILVGETDSKGRNVLILVGQTTSGANVSQFRCCEFWRSDSLAVIRVTQDHRLSSPTRPGTNDFRCHIIRSVETSFAVLMVSQ